MVQKEIPITDILPREGGRLRRLDPSNVRRLADSIAEIGLQTPISVHVIELAGNAKRYHLVTGEHRLEACKSLGWTEIPATIPDLDDYGCELWAIDENLIRAELSELERGDHLRQRKGLYELIHPEAKNGGDRKSDGHAGHLIDTPSFAEDAADKTGMSERAVRRSIHRAEAIATEVKEIIRDMPGIADTGAELDALAAMKPEEQMKVVEAVRSGQAKSVREALPPAAAPPIAPPRSAAELAELTAAWARFDSACAELLKIKHHGDIAATWGLIDSACAEVLKVKDLKSAADLAAYAGENNLDSEHMHDALYIIDKILRRIQYEKKKNRMETAAPPTTTAGGE
jgi:ParB family chromosome partitioning protein